MNLSSCYTKARVTNNPVISSVKFWFIDQFDINERTLLCGSEVDSGFKKMPRKTAAKWS